MKKKINITRIIKSYLFNDSCYIILHRNNYPKHLRQSQIIFVNVICASFAFCMVTFRILHLKTNWFTRHIYCLVNLTIQRFRKKCDLFDTSASLWECCNTPEENFLKAWPLIAFWSLVLLHHQRISYILIYFSWLVDTLLGKYIHVAPFNHVNKICYYFEETLFLSFMNTFPNE